MERKKPRQLYLKLFWTYTVIVLCIVLALTIYFISVSRKHMLEANIEEMERMNQACITYIDETEGIADYIYKDLYRSKSKLEDLMQYLKLEPDAYEEYYLNRYAATSDLVYEGIINFLTEAFDAYPELEQVELISYENFQMTRCLPDQIFYPGRDGKTRLAKLQSSSYKQEGKLIYVKEIRSTDTMENVGCMIFTFKGEEEFAKIQEDSDIIQTVICSEYDQPVFQDVCVENWGTLLNQEKYYQEKSMTDQYTVYSFQSKDEAERIEIRSFLTIAGAGVVAVILGILCIGYYVRRLTTRVGSILNAMNEVTTGDLQVRLPVNNSKDELDMIACNFNDMCEKLELYIQKSYLAEIEQKNAQMQALQSQINPHFLYNTLDTIYMLARINKEETTMRMIQALSKYLRLSLSKGNDIVTVADELENVKSYMEIQQIRNENLFSYTVDCQVDAENTWVLKLILQPLVENAIKYGFCDIFEGGIIRISVKEEKGFLYLEVYNSGMPMKEELCEKINALNGHSLAALRECFPDREKGYGIFNIVTRLRLKYGEKIRFCYETNAEGTTCIIQIPEGGR